MPSVMLIAESSFALAASMHPEWRPEEEEVQDEDPVRDVDASISVGISAWKTLRAAPIHQGGDLLRSQGTLVDPESHR